MSNDLTKDLANLGQDVLDIWLATATAVFDRFTPEEKALALRVSTRAAKGALVTIMARDESPLDKANIDAQVARMLVGVAIDEREIIKASFWPSVFSAIEDGFGMLVRLLK